MLADEASWCEHAAAGYVFADPETVRSLALRFDPLRAECYRASESAALIGRLDTYQVIWDEQPQYGSPGKVRLGPVGGMPCTVLREGIQLREEGLVMSDHMPAQEDHSVQPGSEPSVSDTAEFAAMRAVMRASEKHREGGVDPELEDTEPEADA